jgi:hypothetical protein
MIFSRPKTPDGRNPESIFQQRMIDAPQGLQAITVQGQRTSRTTRGTYSIPEAAPAGAGGAVKGPYRLTAMQGDYLICRKDDSVPDGPFVYIAFADDADGGEYTRTFAQKKDVSKYFIGVKTSLTVIADVTPDTFTDLWKAWTPVYIAKEQSIRDSVTKDSRWWYKYSPAGTEIVRVRSVYQPPSDPTAEPTVLIEVQMVGPQWLLNEAVYAVSTKTEVKTPEIGSDSDPSTHIPAQAVTLLIYGRPALWVRLWST